MRKRLLWFHFFCLIGHLIHAQPMADFHPSRYKICSGSTIDLVNLSSGASTFQWLIDGQLYSASADTQATLVENCYDMKTITLIACDSVGSLCDTARKFVEVFDSCFFHWTGDFVNCPGDTINLSTHAEAIATSWDISGPYSLLGGCDTCPSISFIIQQQGQSVDRQVTYQGNCSEITSFHYLCSISSIKEIESEFELFPNPSMGDVRISGSRSGDVSKLLVYDSFGRIVKELFSIQDVINLPPGINFLRFFLHDHSTFTKKVVVED